MAVLTSLQNGTSSNQNLVTGVTIQGYAASAGQYIRARAVIAQLNGAAATLTVGIRNTTDSAWAVEKYTVIKGTAADTAIEINFPPFFAQGKTYAMFIQSSNASDTTTPDVTGDWYDITKVDLDAVKGTSNNASGLGSAGGDYYNNTRFNANVTGVDGVTATWSGVSGSVLFLRGTTWSTLTGADVNAQCDTAMSDYGALQPTTAGRKLDVTAGGNAGIDWANIESPTTTVDLSGTTVAVVTDVFNTVTANMTEIVGSTNAAVGAALMGVGYSDNGKINANVTTMAANTLTASALAADAVTEIQSGLMTSASYTAPLSAAGTRTALGMSSANLDTQLGAIVADTNELQTDWVNGGRLDLILDAAAASASSSSTAASQALTNTNTIITNLAVVDDNVDAIKLVTVKLDSMLVNNSGWQFSSFALGLAEVNITLDQDDLDYLLAGGIATEAGQQKILKRLGEG